ncbi:MAG TPA: carboxypeptidase regulatory-like domain-containing protein [Thermoplasmata archaeon]|nr:carboxypeptidase regulatory-like domain-containing protein [Thermoplasmata archaeon]
MGQPNARAGDPTSAPGRWTHLGTGRVRTVASLVLVAVLTLSALGGAAGHARTASTNPVVAIWQSANVTEQGNLTVSMEVTDPALFHFVFFQFCQLSSSVCYTPAVVMTLHGASTFVGTTKKMSAYPGMLEGVHAGYNITIEYANGTNASEPSLPNTFTNLSVVTTVANYFDFDMVVVPQSFGLSGAVSDASTHAPVAGASVALSPGSYSTIQTPLSGAYSFSGVPNGTYSLSVSRSGYSTTTMSVKVSGQNAVQNVALSNGSTPIQSGPAPKSPSFLATPLGLAVVAVAVVAVVAILVALLLLRRRPKVPDDRSKTVESTPAADSGGPT